MQPVRCCILLHPTYSSPDTQVLHQQRHHSDFHVGATRCTYSGQPRLNTNAIVTSRDKDKIPLVHNTADPYCSTSRTIAVTYQQSQQVTCRNTGKQAQSIQTSCNPSRTPKLTFPASKPTHEQARYKCYASARYVEMELRHGQPRGSVITPRKYHSNPPPRECNTASLCTRAVAKHTRRQQHPTAQLSPRHPGSILLIHRPTQNGPDASSTNRTLRSCRAKVVPNASF